MNAHLPKTTNGVLMLVIVVQAIVAVAVISAATFLAAIGKLEAEATVAILTGAVTLAGGIAGIVTASHARNGSGTSSRT